MVTYTLSVHQFFAVNLKLKLFSVTVADADIMDIRSLQSLRTFLKVKYFVYHILVKLEQNRIRSELHKIWSFLTKKRFSNHFDKALAPF